MRSRLVVTVLAAMAVQACAPPDSDLPRTANSDGPRDSYVWLYDEASPLHGVVPIVVQQMRHADPMVIADAVCTSLGGRFDFMQPPLPGRERIGFNCAFAEPGLTMTQEMGELRRIHSTGSQGVNA